MDSDERLIRYAVDMISRSSEYDLSEKDLYEAATELSQAKGGKVSGFDETRKMLFDCFEEVGISDIFCNECEEWKFLDQNQETYYCPVCEG